MRVKSLKMNAILNLIKSLCSMIFPLITFPYVSRIFSVESLGKIGYSNAIVSYFMLFSGLGIATYGIREGAKCRANKSIFQNFVNEVFSIHVISATISYVVLMTVIFFFPSFYGYQGLMLLQSIMIPFSVIGLDWVNSVYEDYLYLTIRGIVFQFLSMILMFSLVHKPDDVYRYATIAVFPSVAMNIANTFYMRRYCRARFVLSTNLRKHLKSIFVIFSSGIASNLYSSLDSTMLGLMKGDYEVGIYAVAGKVYGIMKQLMFAMLIVSLPRFSAYYEADKYTYKINLSKLLKIMFVLVFPAMTGIILLSRHIVLILSGEKYLGSIPVLCLLSIALLFATFAFFSMELICLPMNREREMMWATIFGAVTDFVLNLIFIPKYGVEGAAFGTIGAELIVFIFLLKRNVKLISLLNINTIQSVLGSIVMALFVWNTRNYCHNTVLGLMVSILIGVCSYFITLRLMKNEIVLDCISVIKKKVNKCFKAG